MTKHPYRLLAPGPVQMHPEVLKIISEPIIHHRTPRFDKILNQVLSKLKIVFETKQPVLLQTSTGSGVMESSLINTVSENDKVICINSGKFGERWVEISKTFNLKVIEYKVPWGQSADPSELGKLLKQNPDTKAVLTQVSETSTGALHPIKDLASVVKNYPETILIVDAITALCMTDLRMDDWGIDVVVAGSQKAFMLPPGLGFIALSEKAWSHCEKSKLPKYYWDLKTELKCNKNGETRFTSAVSHILGLNFVLDYLIKFDLENYKKFVLTISESVKQSLKVYGFSNFPQNPSPALSTLTVPNGLDGQKIRQHLEDKYNITIAGGQDQLKGKVIRIGHMGYIEKSDIVALAEGIGCTLKDLNYSVDIDKSKSEVIKTFEKFGF